jgi:hypothetical protein
MLRPFQPSDQPSASDPDSLSGSLLRRLREDPQEAINRIAGDIGPRRATSLGEARAAAYLDGRMRRAGLRVSADAFRTAVGSGWDGVALAMLATAGVALYYWLPLPSLFLALWNLLIAIAAQLRPGMPLLARKRPSQNVIATRAITGSPRRRTVLLAPLDSPPVTGRLARLLHAGDRPPLGRVVACAIIALFAALSLLQMPLDIRRALWYGQMLGAAYLLLLAGLDIQAMRAQVTAGAVNHAGALTALLESAEALSGLDQTELWAVGLGATSTGAGLADLLRRYPFDPEATLFLGIESIGGGRLSYLTREGLLPQRIPDGRLLQLIAAADAADPLIDAEPRSYRGEPTLARALLRAGYRAIAIIGLDADGRPALRGSANDTPDQIDAQMLDRAVRLIVGLVKQIDATSFEV